MRLLLASVIPALASGLRRWVQSPSREPGKATDPTRAASERYLLYFTIPLWVVVGLLDYAAHRKTSIETTAGTKESLIHALMMTEAGLPMVLGLVLEINAGVILLMILAFLAHGATAIWDVTYAAERRTVTPAEQHVHSFLEVLPLCAVSTVICLHPEQFAALFGAGKEPAHFQLRLKQPRLSRWYIAAILISVSVNALAYGDELVRCLAAARRGLTGVDTPPAARELYGNR